MIKINDWDKKNTLETKNRLLEEYLNIKMLRNT